MKFEGLGRGAGACVAFNERQKHRLGGTFFYSLRGVLVVSIFGRPVLIFLRRASQQGNHATKDGGWLDHI